jgi:transposase
MIRCDAIWLCTQATDMRCGMDTLLAQVIKTFGGAKPHHLYLFSNSRNTRIKAVVHDGFGVWLANRRLNQGKFVWQRTSEGRIQLNSEQFDALILGLPWQQLSLYSNIKSI